MVMVIIVCKNINCGREKFLFMNFIVVLLIEKYSDEVIVVIVLSVFFDICVKVIMYVFFD